jgi:hypothetical protein
MKSRRDEKAEKRNATTFQKLGGIQVFGVKFLGVKFLGVVPYV